MKKTVFNTRIVFIFLIILNLMSYKAALTVNTASYLKIVSKYLVASHLNSNQWKDIAIKFDKPVRFTKDHKPVKLLMDNTSIPITTKIEGSILYIHPQRAYSYNKSYSAIIPSCSLIDLNKVNYNAYTSYNFTTQNISNYNSLGPKDYRAGAEEFYNFIHNNYPYLEMTKSVTGFDFEKNKTSIINKLAQSKSKEDFGENLAVILNKMLPGTHTKPANLRIYMPEKFMFIYLNGGYVVVTSSNPDIQIGDTVTKINGENIDRYIAEGNNVIISNVDLYRKKPFANSSKFLKGDALTFTFLNEDNEEYNLKVNLKKVANDTSVYLQPAKPLTYEITTNIITQGETAYLKVPTFTAMNFSKVDNFINSIQGYKNLIVDVRNNAGGDLGYAKQLISRLIQMPYSISNYIGLKNTALLNTKYKSTDNFYDETNVLTNSDKKLLQNLPGYMRNDNYSMYKVKINLMPAPNHFNGKVYILTNNLCFSACEYFCNTLKRIGAATLVGGNTGGDGILFVPESKTFLLNTVNISYSYTIGLQEDGTINQLKHTEPDFYIEQDKDDYIRYLKEKGSFSDYDTVLNKCLDIISSQED